jgi:L-alanine-DL-glutamate epimerase-like enolase superfamily enzyme
VDERSNVLQARSDVTVRFRMRVAAVPLRRVIESPNYRIENVYTVIVDARGGSGAVGLSMLWFLSLPQAKVVLEALRYLAPVAASGGEAAVAARAMRREMNFLGYKGVTVIASAGLEMALRDLAARDGASRPPALRDRVPAYWSGFFSNETIDGWLDEAEIALARGFRTLKVRVGARPPVEDAARIARLRVELPDETRLMLDANQGLEPPDAIELSKRLAEHRIVWFEDPIVHCDYPGLAQVVRESPIPIASGENEYLREGFGELLATGVRYLVADLERVGGFGEWDAISQLARGHGATLTPHLYPHVSIHLSARLDQTETWLEYVDWWEPLGQIPLELADGEALVPEALGLGFEPDAAAIERLALGPWELLAPAEGP